jgi:hypothetical protein
MVNNCANPKCGKPLHYLREGRIFVFDLPEQASAASGKKMRRIEHFWLCGECSRTMDMRQSSDRVQVFLQHKTPLGMQMSAAEQQQSLAS